jgi:hypothetical protein
MAARQSALSLVIPGRAAWREPGIHTPCANVWMLNVNTGLWIPDSREDARPGMTGAIFPVVGRPSAAGADACNSGPIVRGLMGSRLMILFDESRRAGRSKHTQASGRSRALAGGACRRCRDRPHLCQPSRTGAGESDRRGSRKLARALASKIEELFTTPRAGEAPSTASSLAGLQLIRIFLKIESEADRKKVLDLAKQLAPADADAKI